MPNYALIVQVETTPMKLTVILRIVLLSIAAWGTSLAFGQIPYPQDGKQLIPVEQAAATSGQGRKWAVVRTRA